MSGPAIPPGAVDAALRSLHDTGCKCGGEYHDPPASDLERLNAALEAAAPAIEAEARELLTEAADALWESSKAALVVKPTLDTPYPDDPRWTPWTRWVEPKARRAHDVAMKIRKHLREQP